ncbi:cation-translocating P-type ATPase [Candidatus Nomurabacteria bacterium]|nr:cation-translocating P-type ATPase [Candidatus Nomurabacteria bacterium]
MDTQTGSPAIFSLKVEEIASEFHTDTATGLDDRAILTLREKYGLNTIVEKKKRPLILKFLDQFKDFMVIILLLASAVSAFVKEWVDALVIVAIVLVNAILGIVQEGKAEKAIEALKKMSSPNAKVIRNGQMTTIPASEVVPGDICVIEAGDIVPADMRLTESSSLKIEEASLTGESVPVEKDAGVTVSADAGLGDRLNMCYMSTSVTYGRGTGIVVGTGSSTEIGRIAEKLTDIKEESTPLQKNLNKLGKLLGVLCLAVCAVVFVHGIIMGGEILEVFMTAISLAVAAIPEGLPAVVTIVLALGMRRLADKNAIMKQLLAVETLGSVDVICTDKTGTLTQNEMTVKVAWVYNREYLFDGRGYSLEGEMTGNGVQIIASDSGEKPVDRLMQNAALCTDAVIRTEEDEISLIGEPTEGAIIVAAEKSGISVEEIRERFPRKGDLPFDSERKMMTTFHDDPFGGGSISFTKGAPDIVLGRCDSIVTDNGVMPLNDEIREAVMSVNSSLAGTALRILGFAMKKDPSEVDLVAESDMTFIGLTGMIDPERPEAKAAIAVCKNAGIRAVMITGDYMDTAKAIAANLGLSAGGGSVMSGRELDSISDMELKDVVERTTVYARVSPEHKVRIVSALRENGHIAAMTGDGVNDAMALKKADIGVAMGITGTEVAKNTANMILTDDNFATIVSAVKEGRIIYGNIRKFVGFLLSCNVGEILVIFITSLIMGPKFVPLIPIQLLWLNLVTDSFPALALGREKGEPGIMNEKPRDPGESIINRSMLRTILTQSIAIFVSVFAAFLIGGGAQSASDRARTFAFVTLVCAELIRAFSARSEHTSVFRIGLFSNKFLNISVLISAVLLVAVVYLPFMQPVFHTVSLSMADWGVILSLSVIPFAAAEIQKVVAKLLKKRNK